MNYKQPDPKNHQLISFIKSGIRISGYICLPFDLTIACLILVFSELVNYYTPYMEGDKFSILQDGEVCCKELGLDFDEVYKRTNTSYKPIKLLIYDNLGFQYEEWFSDYKSASSVERVEAFMKLGRPDPVKYADENGPVVWQTVVSYVSSVLENHEKETSNN